MYGWNLRCKLFDFRQLVLGVFLTVFGKMSFDRTDQALEFVCEFRPRSVVRPELLMSTDQWRCDYISEQTYTAYLDDLQDSS